MSRLNDVFDYNSIHTKENSSLALTNRLFVSGWSLNKTLHSAKKYNNNFIKYFVDIEKINNTPVSVIAIEKLINEDKYFIQIFTKKNYRRKGIAKKLLNKTIFKLNISKKDIIFQEGNVDSKYFWNNVLI